MQKELRCENQRLFPYRRAAKTTKLQHLFTDKCHMLHLHQSWKKSKQHSHFSQATDARSICHQPGTCRVEPGPEVSPHAHSYLQGQASPKGASREPAQCLRTQGCSMVLRAESVQSSSATPKEVGYDGEEIPLGQAERTLPPGMLAFLRHLSGPWSPPRTATSGPLLPGLGEDFFKKQLF